MNRISKSARFLAILAGLLCCTTASAQISVRSPLSDDREVEPGSTYSGQIMVMNETDKPQQAKIYQTDYLFFADGSNIYGQPGKDDRSNADWTRISASVITLPPGEIVPVEYSVSVPNSDNDGALEGSYWSMIMIESIPEGSIESTLIPAQNNPNYGVLQILRYGVQVATHIVGTGESKLNVDEVELSFPESSLARLHLRVENDGSRMIRPNVWIELYRDTGELLGRFAGTQSRIYPDTSVLQRFDLGQLSTGSYRALLILDGGGDSLYASEFELTLD